MPLAVPSNACNLVMNLVQLLLKLRSLPNQKLCALTGKEKKEALCHAGDVGRDPGSHSNWSALVFYGVMLSSIPEREIQIFASQGLSNWSL